MTNVEAKGAVHWIDHYVVGANDLPGWSYWVLNATGLPIRPINGLTTNMRKKNTPIFCFMWWDDESCRIGAFLQPENYPKAKELGKDMPRCGFYIRPEEIDSHLRRLDQHKIPHTDPVKTAVDGEQGTAICFADPDGNELPRPKGRGNSFTDCAGPTRLFFNSFSLILVDLGLLFVAIVSRAVIERDYRSSLVRRMQIGTRLWRGETLC